MPSSPPAAVKSDDARQRLLHTALRLFAEHGFANTSTRELAEAAHVNVAAISYYFGDKAGLYRAVFFAPDEVGGLVDLSFAAPSLTLPEALRGFFRGFLDPLAQGEEMRLCMKLHFREMVEPTGLWQEEITHGIAPMHHALATRLAHELGIAVDLHVHRLAVCITALAVHLHVGRDVIEVVAPGLLNEPSELAVWPAYLSQCALAMVQAERSRRENVQP